MILFIFDSAHLSLHLRGHEPIRKRLLTTRRDEVAITIITAEESLRGRFSKFEKP